MLNERKNRFYASYMTKAREKMRINRNEATIAQVTCEERVTCSVRMRRARCVLRATCDVPSR